MTAKSSNPTRILVVDDHDIIRHGIRLMIEQGLGWVVCGEANDGRKAVLLAEELKPDIIVMDIAMPGLNGLEAARQLRKRLPAMEILIMSGTDTREVIHAVFEAGARSFLPKAELMVHIVPALRALQQHKPYFTSTVSEVVFERYLQKDGAGSARDSPSTELSAREREIVQLVAEGRSSKEVAGVLGVSLKTIESHRAAIMHKLRIQNLAELVRYAIRTGIISA
jgi:two-component system response regulator NreC